MNKRQQFLNKKTVASGESPSGLSSGTRIRTEQISFEDPAKGMELTFQSY
jgi:hypothetical protein